MTKLAKLLDGMRGKNGSIKWYWWLVAGLVLLVALFVANSILKRDRDELAKLRHEKRKAEILEANARAEAQKAEHVRTAENAVERADKAAKRIEGINANIERIEERQAGDRAVADRLTWNQLPRAEDG